MTKNFLTIYLILFFTLLGTVNAQNIWTPQPGSTWQWQLQGRIDQSYDVDMYDIDLFDVNKNTISSLKSKGITVICYFSAGSAEEWRSDYGDFASSDFGNELEDWEGEYWLDTRSENVRNIMKKRLDLAVKKGCDGVEPDNIDAYEASIGFPLTYETQIDYLLFLSSEAHARGLSIGLKNDIEQIDRLVNYFDWALNEECIVWNECGAYAPFINAKKAVFHAEYEGNPKDICPITASLGLSTIFKNYDLDEERIGCEEIIPKKEIKPKSEPETELNSDDTPPQTNPNLENKPILSMPPFNKKPESSNNALLLLIILITSIIVLFLFVLLAILILIKYNKK